MPADHGGVGGSLRDLIETAIASSAADSSVAHALRNHFRFVERFAQPALDPQNGRWLAEVATGGDPVENAGDGIFAAMTSAMR